MTVSTESPAAERRSFAGLISAVQFLTRVSVPLAHDCKFELAGAAVWFPLVGAAIGLFTGTVIYVASHVWSIWPAVIVGMACEALLTGAMHEDALADACDAFGGGWTREQVLRILDDCRLGSYGVLGLTLGVLLRAALIASVPLADIIPVLIASATLGRWAMLPAMAALPPIAGRSSLAEQAGERIGGRTVLIGSALAVPGILQMSWCMPGRLVCAGAALLLLVPLAVAYVRRRIDGITGDCVGAICYLAQLTVLACAAAGSAP